MQSFCATLLVLTLVQLTHSAGESLPAVFDPIKQQLQHIDEFIRAEDRMDRTNTDKAIAVLALKLGEVEKQAQAFADEYEAAQVEEVYLSNKAGMSAVLIEATETKQSLLRHQLKMSEAECGALGDIQSALTRTHAQRVTSLAAVAKLLKATVAAETGSTVLQFEELFQESMDLDSSRAFVFNRELALPSLSPSPSPSPLPPTRTEIMNELLLAIGNFSKELGDSRSLGTQDGLVMCAVNQMRLKLQLAEIGNDLENLTSTILEWRQLADYKHRQLIASEPILVTNDKMIAKLRGQIQQIANAYQERRNGRLRQLCEIVTARQLLKVSEDVVPEALLPGPSQHASSTVPALQDTAFSCSAPFHPPPTAAAPPKIVRCARPPMSTDGRKTLDDSWALLANATDCDQLRAVDVDDLSLLL